MPRPTPSSPSTRRSPRRSWCARRPASTVAPVVVVHWVTGEGVAAFPRLVVDAGADSEVALLEVFVSDARGRRARGAGHDAAGRPCGAGRPPRRAGPGPAGLADRPPRRRRRGRCHPHGHRRRARRRLRPPAHRLPTRRSGRHRQPAGDVVRRGRPDTRLPHLPGARRARHHQRPRLQGRRRRSQPQRLHRPHPGRRGRPGHRRPPDQPQPQAVRRGLGRVGAQPRDPQQRGSLRPRLGRRTDRRRAVLVPREPGRAHCRRRAADRRRLLRRGRRPPAHPGGHRGRCEPRSTASSTAAAWRT